GRGKWAHEVQREALSVRQHCRTEQFDLSDLNRCGAVARGGPEPTGRPRSGRHCHGYPAVIRQTAKEPLHNPRETRSVPALERAACGRVLPSLSIYGLLFAPGTNTIVISFGM